jgi:hypothetical protein
MNMQQRFFLANAAETYGVRLPEYLVEAKTFLDAATKYRTEIETIEQPTFEGVTAKNITKTIDAIIAAAQHGERLTLATRVETIADGLLEDAYMRFKQVLMIGLAKPFDEAAEAFMAVYNGPAPHVQDPAMVATLGELVRLRDQLAGRVGQSTPAGDGFDLPTRVAVLPCKDVIAVKVPHRTSMLQRGSLEWLNSMLSVDGVRLKWQRPDQQAAQVAGLPRSYSATAKLSA